LVLVVRVAQWGFRILLEQTMVGTLLPSALLQMAAAAAALLTAILARQLVPPVDRVVVVEISMD
jgi:hypothetical protein